MSIKRISVKGLFGEFDHDIPLNNEDGITIVYGPNGFGKTFLLTLVNALFNSQFDLMGTIPFNELSVELGNNEILRAGSSRGAIEISLLKKGKPEVKFVHQNDINPPTWFTDKIKSNRVHFVNTDRLANKMRGNDEKKPAAVICSDEIKKLIQSRISEYAKVSHSIDSSFPLRLVKRHSGNPLCAEDLKKRIEKLESRKAALVSSGLLEKGDMNIAELGDISDADCSVLTLYVEDAEKKLAVFDPFACKLELMLSLLNSRFTNKTVSVNSNDGFVLRLSNGNFLQPGNLSSGEQHLLILLYELLFNIKADSLVMIDEPELSLHIYWQQQFLKDLDQIISLTGFSALIATHSPQIIHDRWDLAVELKGPRS